MSRLSSSSTGGSVTIINPVLDVNVVSSTAKNISLVYNEVTNVATSLETTIAVYPITTDSAQLINVAAAGGNIGEIRVYRNADVVDKQYLSYTLFNLSFNFFNLDLANGDVITVTGINNGENVCNFNAKIQIVETV